MPQVALYGFAAACFAACAAIGIGVSGGPAGRIDSAGMHFRAQATRLARLFTISGRGTAITVACTVSFFVFLALRKPLWIPLAMTLSQIVSQAIVESLKSLYARTRPDYWLVGLEAGHSYPSGHSATAVVYFIGWGVAAALGGLHAPASYAAVAVLACWAAGIMWSRLALGAHYVSDVAGGALFGCGWLALVCAAALHFADAGVQLPRLLW